MCNNLVKFVIIILCIFLNACQSDNIIIRGINPSNLHFVIIDSLGNSFIKDRNYKIECGILDSKNNFQLANTYQGFIADYGYNQVNNLYIGGISTFFPNTNSVFYMRTEGTYVDKVKVETDKYRISKVFLNDVEVTAIETRTLPNAYIFIRKTGK